MKRYLASQVRADLGKKLVFLVGPRQVGKTTLARQLMEDFQRPQYLNWDVADDRRIILAQSWSPRAGLLVLDEIHKMKNWKAFLKGAWDGRAPDQAMLVTGSARMDTFRQSGESLAGRYYTLRLHPVSVRELRESEGIPAEEALDRLLERGGFPEPLLVVDPQDADRWRRQYLDDLVREDVQEISRVHEIRALRLFVDMLRQRVGSPVSLASLARDLQVAPKTLGRYLEILEALYVVFTVRPFHHNIARAILKEPKVYFFDTGLVNGDVGVRFENACAAMLLRHVHFLQDAVGRNVELRYIRDKDGREADFAVCEDGRPIFIGECKYSDQTVSRFLVGLADAMPQARVVQIVRELRQEEQRGRIAVVKAADWLAELAA
jgi:predicted AAA+ superfamily ATPase